MCETLSNAFPSFLPDSACVIVVVICMLFYLYGNLELSGEGGHYNLQSDVKKSIADIHREKSKT